MIRAIQRHLNLLQLIDPICEILIINKYTKLKRILHITPFWGKDTTLFSNTQKNPELYAKNFATKYFATDR